jgi:hypothetical protein
MQRFSIPSKRNLHRNLILFRFPIVVENYICWVWNFMFSLYHISTKYKIYQIEKKNYKWQSNKILIKLKNKNKWNRWRNIKKCISALIVTFLLVERLYWCSIYVSTSSAKMQFVFPDGRREEAGTHINRRCAHTNVESVGHWIFKWITIKLPQLQLKNNFVPYDCIYNSC